MKLYIYIYIISERRCIIKLKPACFFKAIEITYGLGLLWYYFNPGRYVETHLAQ
jgi:hypothetical protein